jgi:hypothetical protein
MMKTPYANWVTSMMSSPNEQPAFTSSQPLSCPGESFFLEGSPLQTDGLPAYLHEFSETYPQDFPVIPLDKARVHPTQRVGIPDKIRWWFLAPHSPAGNPLEPLGTWLKTKLAWK